MRWRRRHGRRLLTIQQLSGPFVKFIIVITFINVIYTILCPPAPHGKVLIGGACIADEVFSAAGRRAIMSGYFAPLF